MSRLRVLVGFMLLLWLPMFQMATGWPRLAALDENRARVAAPVLKSWRDTHQYAGDAVKWFNDNFGFRDFLIRSKTQLDYSVFGMSTRVHAGTDGWLFYRSVMDVEKPNVEQTLKKNAEAVVDGTRRLAFALKAQGVQLIIMIAPMKDVYYGQYLPKTAKQLPSPRQVELLEQRLRGMTEIVFLDSSAILKELARKRAVFHKTDFHWNDPAAFEVARSLVNQIGKLEGRTSPVWMHDLQIERKSFSGGEASFMPIFYPPTENGLFVKQNWLQPPFNYAEKQAPFEWVYEIKEPTGHELPPITIVGDSFYDGMSRSGVGIYFKKIYKAKWGEVKIAELARRLPADSKYLLLEFIEVNSGALTELAAESQAK
jgi:hypothetical protein